MDDAAPDPDEARRVRRPEERKARMNHVLTLTVRDLLIGLVVGAVLAQLWDRAVDRAYDYIMARVRRRRDKHGRG